MSGYNTEQLSMDKLAETKLEQPVTCLGINFINDEERRAYFSEELRKKLPELKQLEGFPIGEDEDILALSDPPYYTACPNPWLNDFIKEWEVEKKKIYGDEEVEYNREPFAVDVSEGKNNPIYNVHSYHTKVPYKAILRYILHYTNPGDIVFDGFSGTGMTGLAAQAADNKKLVETLGYKVKDDGAIISDDGKEFSKLGSRKVILNDLSTIATFISNNFNRPVDIIEFEKEARKILSTLRKELEWMYETVHVIDGVVQKDVNSNPIYGQINFTVWTDVFLCPQCSNEIIYWDSAIDKSSGQKKEDFNCQNCGVEVNKRNLERAWETQYDNSLNQMIRQAKQIPVIINYSVGSERFEKEPDENDLLLLEKINEMYYPNWYPTDKLPDGYNTNQPIQSHGVTHVHHFYTRRNMLILAALNNAISNIKQPALKFMLSSMLNRATKMNRLHLKNYFFGGGGCNAGSITGILYISSISIETSVLKQIEDRIKGFLRGFSEYIGETGSFAITTGPLNAVQLLNDSVDYIFTDPPFGGNIMYSELNYIWESWLKVFTNNKTEAIVNPNQNKNLSDYKQLMESCFSEYFRVLKPGRWMTVEFSNSQASVWNAIQEAIQRSGFVIANVSALDKKQGSFKAVTTTTAVKQDLVISAYKPSEKMREIVGMEQGTEESAWGFVKQHFEKLPVFIGDRGRAEVIVERTPRVLFDRMVAFHVQNGLNVPMSSAEFQLGITQRFPMRDGMAFLETQVAEYDKKRILVKDFTQMSLFVSDENSAIEWLRQQLLKKPQTRQDLHPNFMKEIQHIAKHEILPELDDLLNQNFLLYNGDGSVPSQIHSYLSSNYPELRNLEKDDLMLKAKAMHRWYVPDPNKQADLEKLREKSLLREFESYQEELATTKKKLKQFRTEAIRSGFKKAWGEKDYQAIVMIGERLPQNVLQEDDKLLMYYDNAQIRLGV